MLVHVVALAPGRIVPHVSLDEVTGILKLFFPQVVFFNYIHSVRPRMVILRIFCEEGVREPKFPVTVGNEVTDEAAMSP